MFAALPLLALFSPAAFTVLPRPTLALAFPLGFEAAFPLPRFLLIPPAFAILLKLPLALAVGLEAELAVSLFLEPSLLVAPPVFLGAAFLVLQARLVLLKCEVAVPVGLETTIPFPIRPTLARPGRRLAGRDGRLGGQGDGRSRGLRRRQPDAERLP